MIFEKQMSTRSKYLSLLKQFDAPELKTICTPVPFGTRDMPWLWDLRKVCGFTDNGVGLAAPQIGILQRAIFVCPDRRDVGRFMINPEITQCSINYVSMVEGCLS